MTTGPKDLVQGVDTSGMLDLGPILLPNVPGLEVHLDLDPRSGNGKSVSLHLNMSIAEVQLFATATNEDEWAPMRDAIVNGLREQGVDCRVELGAFGTEVRAVMPTVDLDGSAHVQPVRFIGIRGNRWLMRIVVSGDGALEPPAASSADISEVDQLISQLVVNRGDDPRAPGERLWLRSPEVAKTESPGIDNQDRQYENFHIQL